jgi:hypothetical protein
VVPEAYVSEQSVGQVIPVPVMMPSPVTPVVRVCVVGCDGVSVKVAVTERFRVRLIEQVGVVPLQLPPHAVKVFPSVGVAVTVTRVLYGTVRTHGESEHVCPLVVVTVPCPRSVIVSVRVCVVDADGARTTAVVFVVVLSCVFTWFRVASRKSPVPSVRPFGVRMMLR